MLGIADEAIHGLEFLSLVDLPDKELRKRIFATILTADLKYCVGGEFRIDLPKTIVNEMEQLWQNPMHKSLSIIRNDITIACSLIQRLRPGEGESHWVDNEILNTFLEIVNRVLHKDKYTYPSVFICNTFFCVKAQEHWSGDLARWLEKVLDRKHPNWLAHQLGHQKHLKKI